MHLFSSALIIPVLNDPKPEVAPMRPRKTAEFFDNLPQFESCGTVISFSLTRLRCRSHALEVAQL